MKPELEAKKNELAQIDEKIAQYKELREKKERDIALMEASEARNESLKILGSLCCDITKAINCTDWNNVFVTGPQKYCQEKRDNAIKNIMASVAEAINSILPDVVTDNVCAKVIETHKEVVDAIIGRVLYTASGPLSLVIGSCPSDDQCTGKLVDGEVQNNTENSEIVSAYKTLVAVCDHLPKTARALLPMSTSRVSGGEGALAAKALNKESLRQKYNSVVETLLKLFPNCQLLTIGEGCTVAQVLEAVLAGAKVISQLVNTIKDNKSSKKNKKK